MTEEQRAAAKRQAQGRGGAGGAAEGLTSEAEGGGGGSVTPSTGGAQPSGAAGSALSAPCPCAGLREDKYRCHSDAAWRRRVDSLRAELAAAKADADRSKQIAALAITERDAACAGVGAELAASQERAEKAEREFRDAAAQTERSRQFMIAAQQQTALVAAELEKSVERERVLCEALANCKSQMEAFADQMAGYPNFGRAIDAADAALATPEGTRDEQ